MSAKSNKCQLLVDRRRTVTQNILLPLTAAKDSEYFDLKIRKKIAYMPPTGIREGDIKISLSTPAFGREYNLLAAEVWSYNEQSPKSYGKARVDYTGQLLLGIRKPLAPWMRLPFGFISIVAHMCGEIPFSQRKSEVQRSLWPDPSLPSPHQSEWEWRVGHQMAPNLQSLRYTEKIASKRSMGTRLAPRSGAWAYQCLRQ
nr:hypothetical protein Iba_chr08dCG11080 [Ipomoea batatas]